MVARFIKKSLLVLSSRQTSIFSAAFFIILTTIVSQFLGLFKYRLLVSIFGASSDVGVFLASFKIPDFLFQVIIAGSLSSVFIPIFSEYLAKDKKQEAYRFTSSIITLGVIVFFFISVFVSIFALRISSLIAPGFSSEEISLMASLMRIIVISQAFFLLGTLSVAILQTFQYFLVPGLASSLYNVGIILGILFLAPVFGIYGAAFGVLIGSLSFFLIQIPFLKKVGFKFVLIFNFRSQIGRISKLMIPRSLTLFVYQLWGITDVFFASFISARGFVIYDLAQTLVMAAAVLFGQSIAQASFPVLSLKSDNKKEFISIFLSSFNQILFLTLPISALLIVLRIPVVRLFYGAAKFDWQATVDTGATLAFFSLSVFSAALSYLLSRTFFALKDTKTPFVVAVISIIINIFFAYVFILVNRLPIYFLALSYSIANTIGILLFIAFLDKKINLPKTSLIIESSKIFLSSAVMGVSVYIPIKLLDQLVFDTTRTINLLALTGISSLVGVAAFIFFSWLLNIREAYYMISVFKNFGSWKKMLAQVNELIDGSKSNP